MRIFILLISFSLWWSYPLYAQNNDDRRIPVAASFLLLPPDAKAASLGGTGVATDMDANASYWNIAKAVFKQNTAYNHSLSLNFTPLLANIKGKVSNSYINGIFRLSNKQQAITASINYFTTGNVALTDETGNSLGSFTPNEYALSVGYAQSFGSNWGIGIGLRYVQSNLLNLGSAFVGSQNNAGQALVSDIGVYYQNQRHENGQWSWGLMLCNIGTKLYFEDIGENQAYFLPMNIRIGTQYNISTDDRTNFKFSLDLNKLLVPTPPKKDEQGNIIKGRNNDVSTFKALYQSFYDAPGGFSEELKEIQYGLGVSWLIDHQYALRIGAIYQHPEKGQNRFISTGLGYNIQNFNFDLGYLITYDRHINQTRNNTFVIGASWAF